MPNNDTATSRNLRIGLVVGLSLLSLMVILFFIGSEQKLFSKKNEYHVRLANVSGLAEGNPVQISGVTVGAVQSITLPSDPKDRSVRITVGIQKKFAGRVRVDSTAKLRKLGLIAADSYIDVTPGSPNRPVIPAGGEIPAAKGTDVDRLISSGEDLVDNFVQISYSLKNVLARIDRGEGLIGELTTDPRSKQRITDTVMTTLNKTNQILSQVQSGEGLLGKMVYDQRFSDELTASLRASALSMQSVLANLQLGVEQGDGALAALLTEPSGKTNVVQMLENLRVTSENVESFTASLKTGEGLVPRLMNDRVYADEALIEFRTLINRLSETARKLNEGEGTAGRLISDPSVYESINDILIGINESKLLRWMVRNRQAAGIENRYRAVTKGQPEAKPGEQPPAVEEAPAGGDKLLDASPGTAPLTEPVAPAEPEEPEAQPETTTETTTEPPSAEAAPAGQPPAEEPPPTEPATTTTAPPER